MVSKTKQFLALTGNPKSLKNKVVLQQQPNKEGCFEDRENK